MRLYLMSLILFFFSVPSLYGEEYLSSASASVNATESHMPLKFTQEYDSFDSVWVLIVVDSKGTYTFDTMNAYAKRAKEILVKEKTKEDFFRVLERKTKGKAILTLYIKTVDDLSVGVLDDKFLSPYLYFLWKNHIKIKNANEYTILKTFKSYSELLHHAPQLEW